MDMDYESCGGSSSGDLPTLPSQRYNFNNNSHILPTAGASSSAATAGPHAFCANPPYLLQPGGSLGATAAPTSNVVANFFNLQDTDMEPADSAAHVAKQFYGGTIPNDLPNVNYLNQHEQLFHPNHKFNVNNTCSLLQHNPLSPNRLPLSHQVVKEGYLMKRGEHIKNWRRRYFMLHEDGTFFGYKFVPKNQKELNQPLNNFTVRDSHVTKLSNPKQFSFMIRGLQHTNVVERLFYVENEEERTSWLNAIVNVSNNLKPSYAEPSTIGSTSESHDPPENPRKHVSLQDFDLLKVLGKGTFGKVVLCREKSTNSFYAIKILKKSVLVEKEEVYHTLTENRVLQSCRHPFLTQLKYSFQTPDRLNFVMEYVNGGELYYHLSRERIFTEDRTRFYAAEIVTAIGYLHDMGIVYRDLKLENLLLDADGHIRIADFGLCKEEMYHGALTKTFCGTPEYLAPEILEDNDYGRGVDWWGVGIVTYEMMVGRLPFYSRDHEILFELIMNESIRIPTHLSRPAQDFLSRLLIKTPSKRLGGSELDAVEVMRHPFFTDLDWNKLVRKEITPPWKPDVRDAFDTKYIPEEFQIESVDLTPPGLDESPVSSWRQLEGTNFERFSFYGSRTSLASHRSTASVNMACGDTM